MKKANIIKSVAVLSMLTMVGGGVIAAQAAANNSNGLFGGRGKGKVMEKRADLTAEQKAEMNTKMEAVRTALKNNDYNAWVAAVKAIDANSPQLKEVTATNFADFVAKHAEREAEMTARKTKQEAVKSALANSDYAAWVTAVTAENPDCPLLSKITSSNFASYVQAFKLREQASQIMKDLGVEGEGFGMGNHGEGGPEEMGMMGLGKMHNRGVNSEK